MLTENGPEIYQHVYAYEKARQRLDSKVKKYLDYNYSLPEVTAPKDDPEYDRYMYRNNVINAFVGQVDLLMEMDAKGFFDTKLDIQKKIRSDINLLKQISFESIRTGAKTFEQMSEIKRIVNEIVDQTEELVEANNPANVEAAA